jgi:SAM-dependent methyltransferase
MARMSDAALSRSRQSDAPSLPGANLDYYLQLRHSVFELFPSEAWAWLQVAYGLVKSGETPIRLLDLGCGGAGHWLMIEPLISRVCGKPVEYVGVDLDEDLLAVARKRCPDGTFIQADLRRLDVSALGSGQFDVVQCYGMGFLTVEEYTHVIRAGYQATRQFLLMDPRLTHRRSVSNVDQIWGYRVEKYPRLIMNANKFADVVLHLDPVPTRVDVAGYYFPFKKYHKNVKVGDRPAGTFARPAFRSYLVDSLVTSWVVQKTDQPWRHGGCMFNARQFPIPFRLSKRSKNRVTQMIQYSYHSLSSP